VPDVAREPALAVRDDRLGRAALELERAGRAARARAHDRALRAIDLDAPVLDPRGDRRAATASEP
jgi:hypothetical protein